MRPMLKHVHIILLIGNENYYFLLFLIENELFILIGDDLNGLM